MKIICIDCNKEFEFSEHERAFYERKGLSVPKRCPNCRKYKGLSKNIRKKIGCQTNFEIID